ncbi:MAG TPA: BamA/TamA family outer membrane protein, partial [Stenomitos sp.]
VREGILNSLKIAGNTRTQESVIRRELTLKKGELITREELQENLNRLGRLGFFDDVSPELDPASGSLGYDITLKVKERNTGRLSTSAGWSATEGPLAQLSVANDNFMGRGQSIGASLMLSRIFDPPNRNITTELSFMEPWLDDQRTSLGASIYIRRFYNPFARLDDGSIGFQDQRSGASVTMGRPLFGDPIATPWRGFVTLKGEQASLARADQLGNRTDLPFASLTGSGHDLGFSGAMTLQYDTRNQAINPSSGWLLRVTGEQYVPFADLKFSKLSLEANTYLAATPFLTVALGTRFGGMTDFFGGGIPVYQRYYSYGDYLIRGWRDAEFGGNSFALASLEGRFPIFNVISGVVFGDTGAFWGAGNAPLQLSSLRSGYGVGMRIDTPMGVIRADYGLHRWGEAGQFSIGIGQRF